MNVEESSGETEVTVWLFGKPAWELDIEGADVTEEMAGEIELEGKELHERLHRAAEIIRKLLAKHWEGSGGLYDLWFFKAIPFAEAKKELASLGIGEDEVNIEEREMDEDV